MKSYDLTKAKPPKYWFTPIIWGVFALLIVPTVFLMPIFMFAQYFISDYLFVIVLNLYSFIFILLFILLLNKHLNKRTVEALGFHKEKLVLNYLIGIFIGILMIASVFLLAILFGGATVELNDSVDWGIVLILLCGFLIQGMTEEVINRGYIQNGLRIRWGFVVTMIIQGIFFTGMHGLNPGITVLSLFNLFLYAIFVGTLFYYTDNLWIVGAVHSVWNFVLGPVMGIAVSGLVLPGTIFKTEMTGEEWISGGSFGLEGSIFTTIVMITGSVTVYILMNRKNKA